MCDHKGEVCPNRLKKHAKYDVKNIASLACLGWSVPYLMVFPCLSQDFVVGGNSVTVELMGNVFNSPSVVVMCKKRDNGWL